MKELNEEVLFENFSDFLFVVKDSRREDGKYILEYNYPSDTAAVLMRKCALENGAEAETYYKLLKDQTVGSRERMIVPYETEDDLREFFVKLLSAFAEDLKTTAAQSRGTADGRKRAI